jgi:hypothetical protein
MQSSFPAKSGEQEKAAQIEKSKCSDRMPDNLLIGIDFDNTIICYDRVFHKVAFESGLIPDDLPAGKKFIRNHLRSEGKEDLWTEMQGLVYGDKIIEAESYPGVDDFLGYCKLRNIHTCIVSHKTRDPYRGPKYDLHEAGYKWLHAKGFLDKEKSRMSSRQVYFELTKEEKIQRIVSLKCTHFIDDLPEILLADGIPGNIKKILFDPAGDFHDLSGIERKRSWFEILEFFKTEVGAL